MSTTGTEIRIRKDRVAWRAQAWTSIPNALLLDATIEWEAKGAFAWLSLAADDPEFEVTAKSLADAGPRGRDHAQKMVRQLEEHGWLTRHRRAEAGTGQPVLTYDLHPAPVPLEQRTFRPSTARARKKTFPQVKPESLDGQSVASGDERLDGQALGTDQAKHTAKTPRHVSAGQARKPDRAGPGRSGGPTTSLERDACMHEALWAELRTAGIEIDRGGRRTVEPILNTATTNSSGWTNQAVAEWVLKQVAQAGRLVNPPGFVVSLLQDLPNRPPIQALPKTTSLPPACSRCLDGNPAARTNLRFRQQDGQPCPECHPEKITEAPEKPAEMPAGAQMPLLASVQTG